MTAPFFVSYSRKDERWVDLLFDQAIRTTRGTVQKWLDTGRIDPGERFDQVIHDAIEEACGFVLLVSRTFLESEYVQEKEWDWIRSSPSAERLCWISIGKLERLRKDAASLPAKGREILDELSDLQHGGELPVRPYSKDREHLLVEKREQVRAEVARMLDPAGSRLLAKLDESKYAGLEFVTEGEISAIYSFEGSTLGRKLALKIARNESQDEAFEKGLEIAERFSGIPGFVPIYKIDREQYPPHCVCEYVEGANVAASTTEKANAGLRWSAQEVRYVLVKLCFALKAALVRRDVPHLNVRPSNIILDRTGEPFLSPTGRTEHHIGPPRSTSSMPTYCVDERLTYLLPERYGEHRAFGVRTNTADVYLLGLVGYQMLSGALPPVVANIDELRADPEAEARFHKPPSLSELRPDCPDTIRRAIARMMAIDPNARPQTLDQALEGLMRTPDAHLARVERSWCECLGEGDSSLLFERFYERFFELAEHAKGAFDLSDGWPTARQVHLLRDAVLRLFDYYDLHSRYGRVSEELNPLAGEAAVHADRPNINAGDFSSFRKALVDTVLEIQQLEPDSNVAKSWRVVLEPGVDFMTRRFEEVRERELTVHPPRPERAAEPPSSTTGSRPS